MAGSRILKRLIAMRQNPRNGWAIEDVEFLCRGVGLICRPSANTSHYVVWQPKIEGLLTIRPNRPLKPFYIMLFVQLVERALEVERLELE
jgi:hypothetical protein